VVFSAGPIGVLLKRGLTLRSLRWNCSAA